MRNRGPHHEHDFDHHERRGGRGRMRRGDLRLLLLAGLLDGPAHGYELMKRLEETTGGRWRPSPGSMHPKRIARTECSHSTFAKRHGALPLPCGERVGVRGVMTRKFVTPHPARCACRPLPMGEVQSIACRLRIGDNLWRTSWA